MSILVPPIKCQGIKTKLVDWIKFKITNINGIWYEPFMGSGVVGFNIQPKNAVFSDTNPHLIGFYNDIKNQIVSPEAIKEYLEIEGKKLFIEGDSYYKEVRARFNISPNSFDFIFLNRCCFNGMMRFNSKGGFNVPFCRKPNRFTKSYITKITNQVKNISNIIKSNNYSFFCDSFEDIIPSAKKNDFIYCDPPYIDRYSDYFNSWSEKDELKLFELLKNTPSRFILSTWNHNQYRKNIYIEEYWDLFNIDTKEHFYHLGAKEKNRNIMIESLIYNF
ncbi:Dam family site-specific DNA-(adenine-N6)-methyltransferase [Helicobacter sp. 13S00477-4]|uniref:DNA adenine methylase n=1 Tax=Helicobacter sp. 13S00477-4 TaxID=1905759 RepID=UPI000BA691AC|nr:Dam family site-specific DNA-(adenine-N6)-methyltransferase [Helicobacter sp. 13S00477-4]PAF52216.1 DNA adenine methylase [Helicobacter sp. 13S00477-4]